MQITIRLNEDGEREIHKIKEKYGIKKNAPALEFALLGYSAQLTVVSRFTKRVLELEQEIVELESIISYLESKDEGQTEEDRCSIWPASRYDPEWALAGQRRPGWVS